MVEWKNVMAKSTGSSPDIFYFSGECLILICNQCILNDTNLNNSFKIHHFKKNKKHSLYQGRFEPSTPAVGAPAAQIFTQIC